MNELTFQSIIGKPEEVETHLNGLRKMIDLRGGIQTFSVAGVFLHMLCTTNHLTAVISESQALQPASPPYTPCSIDPSPSGVLHESPLLKAFAVSSGFHSTVVDILYAAHALHHQSLDSRDIGKSSSATSLAAIHTMFDRSLAFWCTSRVAVAESIRRFFWLPFNGR